MMIPRFLNQAASLLSRWKALLFPAVCCICRTPLAGEDPGWGAEFFFCRDCLARIDWIGEEACPTCGQPGVGEARSCRRCSGSVVGFERAAAGVRYRGAVRDLVLRLKFGGQRGAALPLACFALEGARRILRTHEVDGVVAVPLHKSRLRTRGYNQAELIASALAGSLDRPFLKGVVRRTRNTLPQGAGGGGGRKNNVRAAFAPVPEKGGLFWTGEAPGTMVRGQTILLVDDVLSTGSTLDYCGRALLSAGASEVVAAVAAT